MTWFRDLIKWLGHKIGANRFQSFPNHAVILHVFLVGKSLKQGQS